MPEGFNVGVRGGPGGLFILDIDRKSLAEAEKVLEDIVAGREFPSTRIVASGGGGLHVYLLAPEGVNITNASQNFPEKVDIRGHKGMVVGPGSKHKSGSTYKLLDDVDPAMAPGWLLSMLQIKKSVTSIEPTAWDPIPLSSSFESHIVKELKDLPLCVRKQGTAEIQLLQAAGRIVRAYQCPLNDAARLIHEHYNLRHRPEDQWSETELRHKLIDASKYEEAKDWGTGGKLLPVPVYAPIVEKQKSRRLHNPNHEYTFDPVSQSHYTSKIKQSKDGKDYEETKAKTGTLAELIKILGSDSDWVGVWQHNDFDANVYAIDPPMKLEAETQGLSANDVTLVRTYMEVRYATTYTKDVARDAIVAASKVNSFHPIREYFDTLPPGILGGNDVLGEELFGDDNPWVNRMFANYLRSAIIRILSPGEKVDSILCLISEEQGMHKSSFAKMLFGPKYFTDQIASLNTKDASQGLMGKWGTEISELDAIIKADNATSKAFFSRDTDYLRLPYAPSYTNWARQCVFIGTGNQKDILTDKTGNRRFWFINLAKVIDLAYFRSIRDQVLANALAEARAALAGKLYPDDYRDEIPYRWWFTPEEERFIQATRQQHMKEDTLLFFVEAAVKELVELSKGARKDVGVLEILKALGTGALGNNKSGSPKQVASCLKELGCTYNEDKHNRRWFLPDELLKRTNHLNLIK